MKLEDLDKRINENAKKIQINLEKIEANLDKIDSNSQKIQETSYALDILKDYKKGFNRWHTIAIVFLVLWVITIVYLVYVLNDIGTIVEDNDSIEIQDVQTIDNSHIKIGDDIWEKSN